MSELREQGLSTAAMRNRDRRRQAPHSGPSCFDFCGVGLAWFDGGEYEEDQEATHMRQKKEYEARKKAQAQHEEELRTSFFKSKRSRANQYEEALEVVEEPLDEEEEDPDYE